MSDLAFDPAAERARFLAREPFLRRHWAMALDLAPGIRFQPETAESVADQAQETLRSEGMDPASAPAEDLREAERAFAVLSPRRESGAWSLAATLMLAYPDEVRAEALAALQGLPERLHLLLDDGSAMPPEVDAGPTGGQTRLPSVLALRYRVPEGRRPAGLRARHEALTVSLAAPESWSGWRPPCP